MANGFRSLYLNECQISGGYAKADSISQSQYKAEQRVSAGLQVRTQNAEKRAEESENRAKESEKRTETLQEQVATLQGRTGAGRFIRRARDGLAVVGAVAVLVVTIKSLP